MFQTRAKISGPAAGTALLIPPSTRDARRFVLLCRFVNWVTMAVWWANSILPPNCSPIASGQLYNSPSVTSLLPAHLVGPSRRRKHSGNCSGKQPAEKNAKGSRCRKYDANKSGRWLPIGSLAQIEYGNKRFQRI